MKMKKLSKQITRGMCLMVSMMLMTGTIPSTVFAAAESKTADTTITEAGINQEQDEAVQTEPTETQPAETEPTETEPIETEPAETEPAETEPVETEPVETEPAETEIIQRSNATITSPVIIPASGLIENGNTATVYTSAGLATALTNTKYNIIILGNDIQITNKEIKVAPKRLANTLIIDGNGYTLTEYAVSSYSTAAGIQLIAATTLTNVTIQNMNIIGGNGYGNFRITQSNVTLTYKDVVYTGPQIAYNCLGTVRFEDCDITLAKVPNNGTYIGEAAEAKNVVLAGKVNIAKQPGSTEAVFWVKCGDFIVEPDAVVNVINTSGTGGFVYGAKNAFKIGERAIVNVNTMKMLFNASKPTVMIEQDAQFICNVQPYSGAICSTTLNTWDVTVSKGATLSITTTGKISNPLMQTCGNLTVDEGATLDLIAKNNTNTCCNYVLDLASTGKTIKFYNPNRVLVYNGNTGGKSYSYAINFSCKTTVDITVNSTEYWKSAKSAGDPEALNSATATYKWWQHAKEDGSYNVQAYNKLACKFDTFNVTGYVGDTKYADNSPRKSDVMNKTAYYFGKDCSSYEVCEWNGNPGAEKVQYNLTYDINNPYHANYAGQVETLYSDTYSNNESAVVKDRVATFPNYTGDCKFVNWNTAADGSGTAYSAGEAFQITDNVTLYAIWKSCNPTIHTMYEYIIEVTGEGVSGQGNAGATIAVTFPGNITIDTVVNASGTWNVDVPIQSRPLVAGDIVSAVQTETGKMPSDSVKGTVVE